MMGGGQGNIISASKLMPAAAPSGPINAVAGVASSLEGELEAVMSFLNHPIVQPLVNIATDYLKAQTDAIRNPPAPVAPLPKEEYNPVLYGVGATPNKHVFRYD